MADFSGKGSGTTGGSSYTLTLTVKETSTNTSANTSKVDWSLKLKSGNYSFSLITMPIRVNVDGSVYSQNKQISINANSTITLCSGSKTITHNADGNKTISCSASMNNTGAYYLPGNISCSGSLTLSYIPRYANFTSHYIASRSINTISVYWSADRSISAWQHSINGGSWQNCDGGNTYKISGLQPNTTYNIRTRIQSSESGLWTESGTISATTYDYAKLTSSTDLVIGSNLNIQYSNPSGATISIGIVDNGNLSIIGFRNCSDNNYTFNFTDDELDKLYKLFGNSNTYKAKICIQTSQNAKTYSNYKDINVLLTGNMKTSYINPNNSIKRAKVYINVDGIVRQAVTWIKKDGIVRRCI